MLSKVFEQKFLTLFRKSSKKYDSESPRKKGFYEVFIRGSNFVMGYIEESLGGKFHKNPKCPLPHHEILSMR